MVNHDIIVVSNIVTMELIPVTCFIIETYLLVAMLGLYNQAI